MQFSKIAILFFMLSAAFLTSAQESEYDINKVVTDESLKQYQDDINKAKLHDSLNSIHNNNLALSPASSSEMQKKYTEQLQQSGYLDQFTPKAVDEQVKPYQSLATGIAEKSMSQLPVSLEKYAGLNMGEAQSFTTAGKADHQTTLKAIFVSFSMTPHELREAFKEASQHSAEIYFNGMHPDDKSIMETMNRIREILKDADVTASARYHPKAFTEFEIKSVPALLYAEKGKVGLIHGLLNMDYLKEKLKDANGLNDFGFLGPTRPVIERNLLDEIASRANNLDGEKLKKQAVDNYWKKQQFISLPDATKDEEFYIDPTVQVKKDIVNPRGEVLARAGEIVNPLKTASSKNIYIAINAKNNAHIEWLHSYLPTLDPYATVMVMTSQLDQQKGWNHLAALRSHFKREIYILPKEMVSRFTITALPAVVSTDMEKALLKIQQIKLKRNGVTP